MWSAAGKKTTAATWGCRCFIGLFAFALPSFKLQFSAANTSSHRKCEGMEGWRRREAAFHRIFGLPLRFQNVSNYLHLPPTSLWKPTTAFLSSYHPQWRREEKNYASSTLSHLSCKPPRLDDIHPHPPSPGFRHPAAHQNGNESWKKTGKERSEDERPSCRKEWWNLRCFSCNDVSHLCVQKVI